MFDPLSLIVGAGLLGGGWVAGRVSRRRAAQQPQPVDALCGCGHNLALHDRESGDCHAESMRKTGYGIKEWARCGCQRYTGPTPLEDFFVPPSLPPSV